MACTRKVSQPARSIFSDLSDISLDDSKMEVTRNLKVSRSHTQAAPGQSRFLKRNQTTGETHLDLKESAVLGSGTQMALGRPLATASKIRASAALMKLAQIETKIRSRQRARTSLSDPESDSKPSEDSLPGTVDRATPRAASGPSSLHAHRTSQKQARESPIPRSSVQPGQVSRFLKRAPRLENAAPEARAGTERDLQTPRPKEPAPKFDSPDSDEEEMKELLGSLMESSREKETSMNQKFTKVLEKERVRPFTDQIPAAPRAPSLPSAEPPSSRPPQTPRPPPTRPAHRALRSRSRACSSQTSVSRDAASRASSISIPDTVSRSESSKMGRIQLASSLGGSEPGPVNAPASEAADDSLNDFRINILSLDDLTPAVSEKSDLEQKEGAARRPTGRSCPDEAPAGLEVPTRAPPRSSAFQGKATSAVGDEGLPTESEVSEHLSASWASAAQRDSVSGVQSPPATPLESSVGSDYSEDFESLPSPVASEPAAPSQAALERALATVSEGSSSLRTCLQRAPQARGQWGRGAARVTVKEAAVQTLDPAFTYQWAAAAGMAAMGPALGGTYVDPAPIASHVISADAIEVH
ncbi:uncharacterized protein C19orf44 homolog isoform X2 [Sciurus carolinensis]|uniref:uncharacterized protein C19orf44 homolog isoform X2 n=1 Tax=Sciurus carolinensis TaxID=30640 RepID=UPI001FB3D201|nr:uncharacterized protein C19orf44 homolog isoform X2 [Sciurus carolinensis]